MKAISNCDCENVNYGEYSNCVLLDIPIHMLDYKQARLRAGLSGKISVDRCILPELRAIWDRGVITYGSCCGHKKSNGLINVDDASAGKMIDMGYKVFPNPSLVFISKTCFI